MRLLYTLLTSLLFALALPAQDCNCPMALTQAKELLATNYAGFPDKVYPATRADYEAHTAQYTQRARGIESEETCLYLLNDWLDWFADPQLELRSSTCACPDTLGYSELTQQGPFIPLTESQVRASLHERALHPLEGIWESKPSGYRVAIVADSTTGGWQAIIMSSSSAWWVPGQVKMRIEPEVWPGIYPVEYYMGNHALRRTRLELYGGDGQFVLLGINDWKRVHPSVSDSYSPFMNEAGRFSLYVLPEGALYFLLPNEMQHYANRFTDNLKALRSQLGQDRPWIIDLRTAQWGSSTIYRALLPYIVTESPLRNYYDRFRVSPDNTDYLNYRSKDQELSRSYRRQLSRISKRMKIAPLPYVDPEETYTSYRIPIKDGPSQVILLTDTNCKGLCELFVSYAAQSDKVTIMGQPTAGSLTYGTRVRYPLGCSNLMLHFPIGRSMGLPATTPAKPIPPIMPDLLLDAEEDWLARALEKWGTK